MAIYSEFSHLKNVIFHSFLYVYQRVDTIVDGVCKPTSITGGHHPGNNKKITPEVATRPKPGMMRIGLG